MSYGEYLIMDGRARFDVDRAVVCEVCDTLAEAKRNAKRYGDAVVVSGDIMEVVWTPEMEQLHNAKRARYKGLYRRKNK